MYLLVVLDLSSESVISRRYGLVKDEAIVAIVAIVAASSEISSRKVRPLVEVSSYSGVYYIIPLTSLYISVSRFTTFYSI